MTKMLAVILLLFIVVPHAYADIDTKMDALWAEVGQREKFLEARAALSGATSQVLESITTFETLKDSGDYDTVDVDLRTALNDWNDILKAARTSLNGNQDIKDIYEWSQEEVSPE